MADIAKYVEDIKKYTDSVNEDVVESLAKSLASVMARRDAALVSCSDEEELARVRKNFIEKKLGIDATDEKAVAATATVCEMMKADRTKNRVTYYYLLAQELRCLGKLA
jgi:hypothetical protein